MSLPAKPLRVRRATPLAELEPGQEYRIAGYTLGVGISAARIVWVRGPGFVFGGKPARAMGSRVGDAVNLACSEAGVAPRWRTSGPSGKNTNAELHLRLSAVDEAALRRIAAARGVAMSEVIAGWIRAEK